MKVNKILTSNELQGFLKSSRKYCELLENEEYKESILFLVKLQKVLLKLYSDAMSLKTIDLISNVDFDEKISNKEIQRVYENIGRLIGQFQYYWTIFDPVKNQMHEEVPVCGDLLDDLMDIYKDLKYSLMIFDLNTQNSIENAIWEFKFNFWHHWSNHAIDASRTIHYILEKTEKYK